MKKLLLVIGIVTFTLSSIHAQISISSGDIQTRITVGKQITTYFDSIIKSINIGVKGNFGTLDFSLLKKDAQYTSLSTSVAVSSTPYASFFPGTTIATKNNQKFSGSDAVNYVYTSVASDSYVLYGIATESAVAGFTSVTKIKYNPAQIAYKLPMIYNATNTQQLNQEIESQITGLPVNPPPTKSTSQFSYSYVVDGYGKIKTAEGKTLDALRVKTTTAVTNAQGTTTTVSFTFITRTGEAISISVKTGQPDTGIVQIDGISWNDGDGSSVAVKNSGEIPATYSLSQNYPNPFNPSTKINFSLPKNSSISLKVYDVIGKEVYKLFSGDFAPGTYSIDFNASEFSSGIYFYKLEAADYSKTMKMILTK